MPLAGVAGKLAAPAKAARLHRDGGMVSELGTLPGVQGLGHGQPATLPSPRLPTEVGQVGLPHPGRILSVSIQSDHDES